MILKIVITEVLEFLLAVPLITNWFNFTVYQLQNYSVFALKHFAFESSF